jgi:hypothetical protein
MELLQRHSRAALLQKFKSALIVQVVFGDTA